MREKLKLLLGRLSMPGRVEQSAESVADVRLATAVLLFEVAKMDRSIDQQERQLIPELLQRHYGFDDDSLRALSAEAEQVADAAISYHPFTRELKSCLTLQQRVMVIEQMWAVAFVDGQLDMHEEHLIRKVADLLYVPHKEFIACKHRARAG